MEKFIILSKVVEIYACTLCSFQMAAVDLE